MRDNLLLSVTASPKEYFTAALLKIIEFLCYTVLADEPMLMTRTFKWRQKFVLIEFPVTIQSPTEILQQIQRQQQHYVWHICNPENNKIIKQLSCNVECGCLRNIQELPLLAASSYMETVLPRLANPGKTAMSPHVAGEGSRYPWQW